MRALLRVLTVGSVVGQLTGRSIGVLAVKEGPAHFEPVADLCVTGEIKLHIDRTFTLEELPDALARVGEGGLLAKSLSLSALPKAILSASRPATSQRSARRLTPRNAA